MRYVSWDVIADGHSPNPITFDCTAGCGSWPCDPAKATMKKMLSSENLLILLHDVYGRAADRLGDDLVALYQRFVKWSK